jgi:hypothetical protein
MREHSRIPLLWHIAWAMVLIGMRLVCPRGRPCALFIAPCLFLCCSGCDAGAGDVDAHPTHVHFCYPAIIVTQRIAFHGDSDWESVEAWFAIPPTIDGIQECTLITNVDHIKHNGDDSFGGIVVSNNRDAAVVVELVSRVRLTIPFAEGYSATDAMVDDSCTRVDMSIEGESPSIVSLVNGLTLDGPGSVPQKLIAFVVEHLTFLNESDHVQNEGALSTLQRGTGNCLDYVDLTVALFRASGIPSRSACGVMLLGTIPSGLHCIVEYGDGGRWLRVDPVALDGGPNVGQFVTFHRCDRPTELSGGYYCAVVPEYPCMDWDYSITAEWDGCR